MATEISDSNNNLMDDGIKLKFDLLKQEIETVQSGIRTYNQVQFTIKGWAITIFSGFLLFAEDKAQPKFLCAAAATVVLFWALDAIFKSIQMVYIGRAIAIEEFLQKEMDFAQGGRALANFPLPNTDLTFGGLSQWHKTKAFFQAAVTPQLALLYVVMLVVILTMKYYGAL